LHSSNKFYPKTHGQKRSWNPNDYPRGAVEEELSECKKSVYLEKNHELEFKYVRELSKEGLLLLEGRI